MGKILFAGMLLLLFAGCKKDKASKVDIYLVKSFTVITSTKEPYTTSISNAVLESEPIVTDRDIEYYEKSTATFKIKTNIEAAIKDYSRETAFAVTVDNKPVYYGLFNPAYLNSIVFGVPLIDPLLYSAFGTDKLKVGLVSYNSGNLQPDKRSDSRILNAFAATGRLR